MMKVEQVSTRGSQAESWRDEGKAVLHQAEGMEVPCQVAVGKVVSYLEGENLEALGNRAVEGCSDVNIGVVKKTRS